MAFGGLSIVLYGGRSFLLSTERVVHQVDLQSAFFALVFVIVFLVLAYLTNPSETSFRTYLTEQSFRQHLSRLEDSNQEDQCDSDDSGVHFTLTRRLPKTAQKDIDSFSSRPFHFINRAAVSLRTPKHVFYSFGIMTIAAVLPTGATNRPGAIGQTDGFMVSESWFIGAFGKWWRGGPIQAWWVDNVTSMKDAERCNAGVLDMKPLDTLERCDVNHLPVACRDTVTKPRVSERSLHRTSNNTLRSSTPPPLPKSASLPLHVARVPHDKQHGTRSVSSEQPSSLIVPEPTRINPPALLPSPSTIFDQSPVISEILRQLTNSKASVHDLKTQLKDFRAAAAESHSHIQSDLDVYRERKRSEDTARAELKARTKSLEDSKRSAENGKRDAEKRLRAAESARDNANERVERLDKEIGALKQRINGDEDAIVLFKVDGNEMEKEMAEQLERKRKEIRVAEEVIAALNSRAKELEEKIVGEEERLRRAKDQADMKKQDRAFNPLHVVTESADPSSLWSPIVPPAADAASDPHFDIHTDRSAQIKVFPDQASDGIHVQGRRPSLPEANVEISGSPRPKHLSLDSISNFKAHARPPLPPPESEVLFDQVSLHPTLGDDIPSSLSSGPAQSVNFSPFSDQEVEPSPEFQDDMVISPRSTSLIPTSLIKTLDRGGAVEDLSRSFQSESDTLLDRDWRQSQPFPVQPVKNTTVFSTSPTSLNFPLFDAIDKDDPFEIRPPPPPLRHRITSDGWQTERVYLDNGLAAQTDGQPLIRARTHESDANDKTTLSRRWFLSKEQREKDKKGLNPEAKVFQFRKFPMFGVTSKPSSMDSVVSHTSSVASSLSVPSLLAPSAPDSNSMFSALSMRAFAPSPEEREALTRAMGSANTSLERLPTLSDVVIGSLPSSPNNVHAIVAQRSPQPSLASTSTRSLLTPSFSWLHSLPRIKKPKFSPWEDEVSEETAVVTVGS